MNILIPMAGAGSRFVERGYELHKPVIPVTSRLDGDTVPMVVAAVSDLPFDPADAQNKLSFIIRDFHARDGVPDAIRACYPAASFIEIDRLTEGQASTCLLARDRIANDAPLIITACDNGMDFSHAAFAAAAQDADALIFTFRHNEAVLDNPKAYGWIRTDGDRVTGTSIKVPISDSPMEDHAVVGTFWFRRGQDFVDAADAMIAANDRINNEFYVDQVFHYMVQAGLVVKVFEIGRYLCWGTPDDYEAYEKTIAYWRAFISEEERIGG